MNNGMLEIDHFGVGKIKEKGLVHFEADWKTTTSLVSNRELPKIDLHEDEKIEDDKFLVIHDMTSNNMGNEVVDSSVVYFAVIHIQYLIRAFLLSFFNLHATHLKYLRGHGFENNQNYQSGASNYDVTSSHHGEIVAVNGRENSIFPAEGAAESIEESGVQGIC